MSRLDDLPPDQKAALSLLLRRHASYADLAALLNISERAVHDRAHAGLAMLAPRQARALTADQREEIGEFLLGQQQGDDRRTATLHLLDRSPEARAWADALLAELAPVGDGALPQMPPRAHAPPAAAAATRPPAPGPPQSPEARGAAAYDAPPEQAAAAAFGDYSQPARGDAESARGDSRPAGARAALPVSRRAGAILLAVLIAGVVLAVVLIPSGGGSKQSAASGKTPASRGQAASTSGKQPAVDKRITLAAAEAGSHAIGVALVLSEGGKHAFYLAAEHMAPSNGFFYAVWLYNSPTSAQALGKSPAVKSDGRLQGGALLPENAGNYKQMIVTRETSEHPTRPGPIVLSGAFALH
jgi:hypothetical protein